MLELKKTHRCFIFILVRQYTWSPKQTKYFFCLPVLTFNMMESVCGVKGMLILVTTGALDWLARFLSHNVVNKRTVITTVPHQNSHWSHVNGLSHTFPYGTCLFTSPLVKGGKDTECYHGGSTGKAKFSFLKKRSFVGFWLHLLTSGTSRRPQTCLPPLHWCNLEHLMSLFEPHHKPPCGCEPLCQLTSHCHSKGKKYIDKSLALCTWRKGL